MSVRAWLGFGALLLTALSTTRAEACGVSASGIASCSLAEHDEATLIARCDPALIESVRRNWPFLRDRRVDAYGGILRRYIGEQ